MDWSNFVYVPVHRLFQISNRSVYSERSLSKNAWTFPLFLKEILPSADFPLFPNTVSTPADFLNWWRLLFGTWTTQPLLFLHTCFFTFLCTYPYLFLFWHEHAAFQRSAFRRSTACNDVVATIFIRLFFFFSIFSPRFFPLSRPSLIEGVLGSKNLFSESCLERPKI